MRRVIDVFLLFAVIGGVGTYWYFHQSEVRVVVGQVKARFLPCKNPITYSIGTVDPRFELSAEAVVQRVKDAETIWEMSGMDLFRYMPSGGDVTINFVYDHRQATTDTLESAEVQIDSRTALYDASRRKYEVLSDTVKRERVQYEQAVSAYERQEARYSAEVISWNERGGAPKKVFDQLEAQKEALQAAVNQLNTLQTKLNSDIEALNALGRQLNELIAELNLNVRAYNEVGASLGEFEEGLYVSKAGVQKIDIYEYGNRTALIRVLAHELGHALGIEHVADTEAIMYSINQGERLELTQDDRAALSAVCSSGIL